VKASEDMDPVSFDQSYAGTIMHTFMGVDALCNALKRSAASGRGGFAIFSGTNVHPLTGLAAGA
jgi:hypothetical protein